MRFLVVLLGLLALATPVLAKPKVAVAPFKGDKNNKVSDAIAEALAGSAKVTDPKATGKAIDKLDLGKDLDVGEAKKLHKKLEVDAVVQGKLEKDGKTQTLKISIFLKGKDEAVRFTVQFTKVNDKFREDVSGIIVKKLDTGDVDDTKKRRLSDNADDDNKKKKRNPDDDNDDKKKNGDGDDDKKNKRVADGDDDGETKVRKKKKKKRAADDEVAGPRKVAARVDVGAFGGVRRLTYSSSMTGPRPVGTRTLAAHVEGEIYPFAFNNQKGGAAGLGFAGEFEKTVGLSITIPGTTTAVPIDQGHFSIGARYRISVGDKTAVVIGTDFSKRRYIADRSGLGAPTELDAPDVDYTAVIPNVGFSTLVSPTIAFWARAGGMLILDTGSIQEKSNYGAAKVFGLEARLGTDIAFSERVGMRLSGGFNQITFKFSGNGDMAMARGVTAAADRNFGLAAMLGVTY
ncbi:MAG: hypothetical protein H0V17_17480 [Deltaproteobacteria bacterium]|nr:hypothetical protein [Deltaproteobacteria bacterium]